MNDKQKLKQLQSRVDIFDSLMCVYNSYNDNYFSPEYLMKMLNLNRNEIRKYKIGKIFND
jgi:hypothetical protein